MVELMHFDGFVLLIVALLFALLGQSEHQWKYRIPYLSIAAANFALSINLFGFYHFDGAPSWVWLRVVADCSMVFLASRAFLRKHPINLHLHLHKREQRIARN